MGLYCEHVIRKVFAKLLPKPIHSSITVLKTPCKLFTLILKFHYLLLGTRDLEEVSPPGFSSRCTISLPTGGSEKPQVSRDPRLGDDARPDVLHAAGRLASQSYASSGTFLASTKRTLFPNFINQLKQSKPYAARYIRLVVSNL